MDQTQDNASTSADEVYEGDVAALNLSDVQRTISQQTAAIELLLESVQYIKSQIIDATAATVDDRVSVLEDRVASRMSSLERQLQELTESPGRNVLRPFADDVEDGSTLDSDFTTDDSDSTDRITDSNSDSGTSASGSWEAIRSTFLNDEEATESSSVDETQEFPAGALEAIEGQPLPEFELPEEIDPDQLTDEQLRTELLRRETLLRTVVGHLRHSKGHAPAVSLSELKSLARDLPEELTDRIERNLSRIDEQLRLGELELSLERARVGRQLSQLQATRQQLESNARQMGLTIDENGSIQADPDNTSNGSRSGRKWLGAMGFGV